MELITNSKHEFQVPVAFVTNSLNTNQDKANQISNWFQTPVSLHNHYSTYFEQYQGFYRLVNSFLKI